MYQFFNTKENQQKFTQATPFPHLVVDDFLDPSEALLLYQEVPAIDNSVWFRYNNAIENKYVCNHWDRFPSHTYNFFTKLTSVEFTKKLSELTGIFPLVADVGLHGGGWHVHSTGGMLNVHKDYSIHPKLKLERALNLILYITPDWYPQWGGGLGLWSNLDNKPYELIYTVDCLFNRAVIFDTRKNSWHGLPDPITCPANTRRISLAIYYLTTPDNHAETRERALFAPSQSQLNDKAIEELINQRSK